MIPYKLKDAKATKSLLAAMLVGQISGFTPESKVIAPVVRKLMGKYYRQVETCMALAAATLGDLTDAKALLAKGLDDLPNKDHAELLLATAFVVQGDAQGNVILKNLMLHSTNEDIRDVASKALLTDDLAVHEDLVSGYKR